MDLMNLLILALIGAVIGWLAGQLMRGAGFGVIGNIIVGILGTMLGGFLLGNMLSITGNALVNQIITGTVGACILLFIVSLIKKAT